MESDPHTGFTKEVVKFSMLDKSRLSQPVNIDDNEIAKFNEMAREWWDPNGKFKTALEFNQARLGYFTEHITQTLQRPWSDLSILDVGSGGGLVSENLAKLGAEVVGIDASATSVEVARAHAIQSGVLVSYQHKMAQDMVAEARQFDVVINAEVVEHVPDQAVLIEQCANLVKPGGLLILATLNRTLRSYFVAILGAEYIMRYLPIGTHDWRKFVKPDELVQWVGSDFSLVSQSGVALNPLRKHWYLTTNMSVNYMQCFRKFPLE